GGWTRHRSSTGWRQGGDAGYASASRTCAIPRTTAGGSAPGSGSCQSARPARPGLGKLAFQRNLRGGYRRISGVLCELSLGRARQLLRAQKRTIEDTQRRAGVQEAAMKLRAHRRNLAAWSPSVGLADRYGAPRLTRLARTRRAHRFIRTGALLTVIGLMRLARALPPPRPPLPARGIP